MTFPDLLKARVELKRKNQFFKPRKPDGKNIEARVRYLEEWLDEYVKGIALVSARAVEAMDMLGVVMIRAEIFRERCDVGSRA